MASDYGASMTITPIPDEVISAYQFFGIPTRGLYQKPIVSRLHMAWSFENKHDFSYSQLYSDDLSSWGAAYKIAFYQEGTHYIAYRLGYSQSERANFYKGYEITNEIITSTYLIWFDFYAGLRHAFGQVEFKSSVPELALPKLDYMPKLLELEPFLGMTVATTTNTRATLQINYAGQEVRVSGKLSFRFDELYPTYENWFRDPRRLYQ